MALRDDIKISWEWNDYEREKIVKAKFSLSPPEEIIALNVDKRGRISIPRAEPPIGYQIPSDQP